MAAPPRFLPAPPRRAEGIRRFAAGLPWRGFGPAPARLRRPHLGRAGVRPHRRARRPPRGLPRRPPRTRVCPGVLVAHAPGPGEGGRRRRARGGHLLLLW